MRRVWPATLIVEIVEIKPVASWGSEQWLNFTGDLVRRPAGAAATGAPRLPEISGPAPARREIWEAFRDWSGQFAAAGLALNALHLDGTGRWTLELTPGALTAGRGAAAQQPAATMVVGRNAAAGKVARFILALKQGFIEQVPAMRHIDLRYPNGFAIRWRDSAAAPQRLPSAQTAAVH